MSKEMQVTRDKHTQTLLYLLSYKKNLFSQSKNNNRLLYLSGYPQDNDSQ